jgi:hypothetical protein
MSNHPIKLDATHHVVARLIEIQGTASDANFAKRLPIDSTNWTRVKNGTYGAADHSRVLAKLSAALDDILDEIAITSGSTETPILPLSHITRTRKALNIAFAEDRNRLVICLTDTGGGKTSIAKSIQRDFPARAAAVEASEPWRNSYLAGIHAIGEKIGIQEDLRNNARRDEKTLIDELSANPRIITIDEGNYFGHATLNLVKLILNNSRSIVVIFAMPVFWNYITRASFHEARQLRNRAAGILKFEVLKPSDVKLVLENKVPGWSTLQDPDRAIRLVCDAGNQFGLWNTVFPAAKFIAQESAESGQVTIETVEQAVSDIAGLRR